MKQKRNLGVMMCNEHYRAPMRSAYYTSCGQWFLSCLVSPLFLPGNPYCMCLLFSVIPAACWCVTRNKIKRFLLAPGKLVSPVILVFQKKEFLSPTCHAVEVQRLLYCTSPTQVVQQQTKKESLSQNRKHWAVSNVLEWYRTKCSFRRGTFGDRTMQPGMGHGNIERSCSD